jgi:hypothetical protein
VFFVYPKRSEIIASRAVLHEACTFRAVTGKDLAEEVRRSGGVFGKSSLKATEKALSGPMAFAIHLQKSGLIII